MAGGFTGPDPVRCPYYAQFASDLERTHFDVIYWVLFIFNILLLFCASIVYMKYVPPFLPLPSYQPLLLLAGVLLLP
jgi:hypothetical protein